MMAVNQCGRSAHSDLRPGAYPKMPAQPDNTRYVSPSDGFIITHKPVGWSVFTEGLTLGRADHEALRAANEGAEVPPGRTPVVVIAEGVEYEVRLANVVYSDGRPNDLQIRWESNVELQALLKSRFAASYGYLSPLADEAARANKRMSAKVPGSDAEHIDVLSTHRPFVYRLNLITRAQTDGLRNVAFKVSWVYGQRGPWTTPCTPQGRQKRMKSGNVWCSQSECRCSALRGTDRTLPDEETPCYDCRAPFELRFASGQGARAGQPRPLKQTGVGKRAILTSLGDGRREEDRIIIACFRIAEVAPFPGLGGTAVYADRDHPFAVRVPLNRLDDAPRYWEFRAPGKPRVWGSLLFRYIDDDEADAMWAAVAEFSEPVPTTVARDLEAVRTEETYVEGTPVTHLVSRYERNPDLRAAAVSIHGTRCQVCGMAFPERYGGLGEGFIEVHHIKPVADYEGEVIVNPETEMAVVCANCHRMLHRKPNQPLTVSQLKAIVRPLRDRDSADD